MMNVKEIAKEAQVCAREDVAFGSSSMTDPHWMLPGPARDIWHVFYGRERSRLLLPHSRRVCLRLLAAEQGAL